MLSIYYGDMDDVIYNTSVYFKNVFRQEWLESPEVIRMIKDVDKSEVLGTGAIKSPVLGVIAPTSLSGGVKTLILIDKVPDKIFNASNCGDNCAEWLLRLAKDRDITINLRHYMHFGKEGFEIKVLNDDVIVHDNTELIKTVGKYV